MRDSSTDKSESSLAGSSRWGKSAAVLALGLGLVVTAAVWTSESRRSELEQRAALLERANQIAADIRQRLVAYELALRGGASLFAATDTPSRQQWRAYVDALKLNESYPGVQAFAFAALLSSDSISLVERSMRANGFPNFRVWPGGPRKEVSAILYVEPLDASNVRSLGYDMLADNARRHAMDVARDSGSPALSGPVTLVQDAGRQSHQTAALMFVPVYRSAAPVGTPKERNSAMLGWVYAPFRPADLVGSIDRGALLALRLYDDAGDEHRTLLYSDAATRFAPAALTDPPMNLSIEFAGRQWVLEARPTAAGLELFGSGRPWEYLAGGIVVSLLLFGIMWSMATTRARANALAMSMTDALRRANQTLDRRVNERTTELTRINEKLRQEIADRELAESARSAALEHEARRSTQLRALADAGLGIGLLPDNQLRLEYLADRICRIVGCAHALVAPVDHAGDASSLVLASLQPLSSGERRMLLEAAVGWPRVGEAGLLAEAWSRADFDGAGTDSSGTGSEVLGVPIGMSPGSAIGTLYLVHFEGQRFADEDQVMVRQLALLAAAAINAANLAEEERRARLEAEAANSMKDQFLAIVSHELRTPLHAILGWLGVIDRRGETGERLAHALTVIRRNAEAQSMLIDDLLDLARIEQGKLQIDQEPVELRSVVNTVIDSHRQAATDRGVRLETRVESGGRVLGDDLRLQQVLGNLVGNSLKFTPAGGRVAVRLHRDQQTLILEVSDTGQGIPPESLEDVFDRFRQADASSRRRHGGLGLGLALVRHIVHLHGGQVSAFSEGESAGATFTVRLPCIDPVQTRSESLPLCPETANVVRLLPTGTPAWPLTSGGKSTIPGRSGAMPGRHPPGTEIPAETDGFEEPSVMLIDRSRDAQALADLLDANDYTVVRFDSTKAALGWLHDRVRGDWPLAVLCDLDPGDSDGPEFVAALRRLEAGLATAESELPVILLSGADRPDDSTLRELLPKPIRPQRLLRLLERLPR